MKLLLWFVSGIKTLPEVWLGFKKDNQKKKLYWVAFLLFLWTRKYDLETCFFLKVFWGNKAGFQICYKLFFKFLNYDQGFLNC